MVWNAWVVEPELRRKDKAKRIEMEKRATEEFERLYEMGGNSCPVLRCMRTSKVEAASIMGQCPVAMKYQAPLALK